MGKFLSRCLTLSCCIYTILTLAFALFGYLLSEAQQPAMTAAMLTALFCFSLLVGFSSALLRNKKLPAIVKYAVHCVSTVGGFLLIYIAVLGRETSGSSRMVCVILTLIVYLIVMLCRAGVLSVIKSKKERSEK